MFKVNDYVSRLSYNCDIIFKIIEINGDVAILEGFHKRLVADALVSDLILVSVRHVVIVHPMSTPT